MTEEKGFIKLNRKITENWLWTDERFTRGQAWIDLLLITQYKDGFFYGKKGRIEYKRGDCTISLSDLAKRWKWSRDKVRRFLNLLEEKEMVGRKFIYKTYSLITILNYDKYQSKEKIKETKKEDDFDYDGELRFLLGDKYDEYMDCKAKGIEFNG